MQVVHEIGEMVRVTRTLTVGQESLEYERLNFGVTQVARTTGISEVAAYESCNFETGNFAS